MTTKQKNKQDRETIKITPKQKKIGKIVGFSLSIILLVLVLLAILVINTNVKSESEKIMDEFYQYYKSEDLGVIFYYNSASSETDNYYENKYMTKLYKDYKLNYLTIDISKLNSKDRDTIEEKIGIEGTTPSVIIVKNENVVAINEGFIESNRLVELLVKAKVLKEGSKYADVSDLTFIDYEKYKKLLSDKKSNVVIIGQAGCEYCIAVKPTLNNIAKAYEIDIYYLDVMEFNKNDYKEFFDSLPKIGYEEKELTEDNTFSMPTVFVTKKGKIEDYISGANSLEEYKEFFKENKIIE